MSRRVLYVGNFEPDHSTENDVRRAFEHLGWEVDRWQERDFMACASDGAEILIRDVRVHADAAGGIDLVLHTMTQGNYPAQTVLDLWEWCREVEIPTASIHLDRFYGLGSVKDSGPQRFDLPRLHPMFRVDHVFTADGDSDELFQRDGVNHHWLPPAVRYDEARDIAPGPHELVTFGGFEVGFCGARGYHPEHDRAGLVDALAARYGHFVRVAGDTSYGTVRGEALNRMYATIPVWVGDSCFAGTSSRYCSDRFFETWGRGGFLVFPFLPGIAELVGGRYPSWAQYADRQSMFDVIDYWLDHPDEREQERQRIAGIVRAEHTYVNRVQTMLDVIFAPAPFGPDNPREENDGSFDTSGDDGWPDGPIAVGGQGPLSSPAGGGDGGDDRFMELDEATLDVGLDIAPLDVADMLGSVFNAYSALLDLIEHPNPEQLRAEFASRIHDLQGRALALIVRRMYPDRLT